MKHIRILTTFLLLSSVFQPLTAQTYQPAAGNIATREWFQDAKFGLFVHWGVYSTLADGEWVMNVRKIDKKVYERLPDSFNPAEFNAAEWVAMVKAAGMRYITITSKHHDGFAMYDSKVTDWDIVDRTRYGRDVLKQLANECHKQGVKLFFYYSQLDWNHTDFFPRGGTGLHAGRPDAGNWDKYIDFMNAQLTELLTNYGPIGGIWFDGWWDRPDANWRLRETYNLIHRLQPSCMVGSNHHKAPMEGEDFQMFEKDLPGHNTTGFSGQSKIGALPLETCETMNNSWGYNAFDRKFKTSKDLIHYLVKAAGNNANFLLNVGPMPNGRIQPEFIDTLKVMGSWLQKYGNSVYGTRGGPVPQKEWGVTTQKGKTVYVHVLNRKDNLIFLPGISTIASAKIYGSERKVNISTTKVGSVLQLADSEPNAIDLVVELQLR